MVFGLGLGLVFIEWLSPPQSRVAQRKMRARRRKLAYERLAYNEKLFGHTQLKLVNSELMKAHTQAAKWEGASGRGRGRTNGRMGVIVRVGRGSKVRARDEYE